MENNDFIFGIRPIIEAVRSGKTIDKLLVKKGLKGELSAELDELIRENHLNCQLVPEEKLNRITRKNHQGVIAFISPIPFYDLDEIIARTYENGQTPFFIYLDQITDVRNFGAIVRTAECAGVQAIIIPEKGAAQIGGDAVKTSAEALHILHAVAEAENVFEHRPVLLVRQRQHIRRVRLFGEQALFDDFVHRSGGKADARIETALYF